MKQYTINNIHGVFEFEEGKSYDIDVLDKSNTPFPLSNGLFKNIEGNDVCFMGSRKVVRIDKNTIVHVQESKGESNNGGESI